jgi:crotonobetainyl-CoA:carnitine CoA-transferase CaiB-like acyl-CoA transferase
VVSGAPTAASGPLTGIRVIEFDDGLAQYCGKLLADMGADVVKVEPLAGSAARSIPPFAHDKPDPNASLYFWHYNLSKRSVVLDLANVDDRDAARELVGSADVVLDGLGPGRLAAAGLDWDDVRPLNPRLIFARITPFGTDGPWAGLASSDLVQLALGGMMTMTGYGDEPGISRSMPIAPAGGQSRHVPAALAAIGIVTALIRRLDSGTGQLVDVAAHDALAHSNEMGIVFWEFRRENVRRHTGRHGNPRERTAPQLFRCRDGRWAMCLTLYMNDNKRFGSLLEWMQSHGLEDDLGDERFRTDPAYRSANNDHIIEVLERFIVQLDSSEVFHEAQARKLPWAPVNGPWDLIDDPHLAARGAVCTIEYPRLGRAVVPGAPYVFSATPWTIRGPAPDLGADNPIITRENSD